MKRQRRRNPGYWVNFALVATGAVVVLYAARKYLPKLGQSDAPGEPGAVPGTFVAVTAPGGNDFEF